MCKRSLLGVVFARAEVGDMEALGFQFLFENGDQATIVDLVKVAEHEDQNVICDLSLDERVAEQLTI